MSQTLGTELLSANLLAGSLIIALALNWGLQGILCLQVYTYYLAFPHDRVHAKLQVYGVLFLEFIQSGVVAHDVIMALAPSLGDLNAVDSLRTTWFSIPVSGGISGGVGQLFFAYRIWMISGEIGSTLIVVVLSFASVSAAMVSAGAFFHAKTFSALLLTSGNTEFAAITVWNGIGAICDLWIALSMPYFLMRNGTGSPATHILIVKLIRLLIETGGLTAILAILHVCLFASLNQLFVIPGLVMSKIYAITMLMILNNRVKISGGRFNQEEDDDEELVLPTRDQRNSKPKTKILVTNERLTFRLPEVPAVPNDSERGADHGSMFDTSSAN